MGLGFLSFRRRIKVSVSVGPLLREGLAAQALGSLGTGKSAIFRIWALGEERDAEGRFQGAGDRLTLT